jgi:predicted MPP superfamily phosphohydrolase
MNVESTKLILPGLTRSYTFCHISDVHVAYAYPDETPEAREMAEKHAQKWNPIGLLPVDALDQALTYADGIHADGVFLCGDCADYFSEGTVSYLKERIGAAGTEVFYVCGNHEGGDYYKKVEDLRACYPAYAPLMQGTPDFWTRDMGDFIIAGMDNSDKKIRREQLDALKQVLARGKPVILLIHIPMYTEAIDAPVRAQWGDGGVDYFTLGLGHDTELSREFCRTVKESDAVAAVFAGHIHLAHAGEFAPGRMQFTSAPAFTGYMRVVTVCGE